MATSTRQRPDSVMRPGFQRRLSRSTAMTGSASLVTRTPTPGVGAGRMISAAGWQSEAWRHYDSCGELRFGAGWVANAMSRVNLVVARVPQHEGDEPRPLDTGEDGEDVADQDVADLVADIAGGPAGQGALIAAAALHLTVPGICYVWVTVNIETDTFSNWRVLSMSEIDKNRDGSIKVRDTEGQWQPLPASDLLIKVWRSHPDRAWEPDSPVRAVLPVLRRISLLDAHITATAESRMAGAGLLIMPEEVEFVRLPGSGPDVDDDDDEDDGDFMEDLYEAMETPITDRSAPSARVPLGAKVPGEQAKNFNHLTFATKFDDQVLGLRDAEVKRLALGLDIPPEIVLGLGGSNHWSAWQITEEAITLHVKPLAEIVCHAFTTWYFRAAVKALGKDPDEFMVWYDATDLVIRPDLGPAVTNAYDRFEASGEALRTHTGLADVDKPEPEEIAERLLLIHAETDKQFALAWMAFKGITMPAMPSIETTETPPAIEAGDEEPSTQIPERSTTPPEQEAGTPNDAALLAACDMLVERALEKVGARLKSKAGRGQPGGNAAVKCDDLTRLHTTIDASTLSDFDALLDGAWTTTTRIAQRYHVNPTALTNTLDTYVRGLVATGHPHDYDHLAYALGIRSAF